MLLDVSRAVRGGGKTVTSRVRPPRMTDAQEALIDERVTQSFEPIGAVANWADARACSALRFIHVQDARGRLGGARRGDGVDE